MQKYRYLDARYHPFCHAGPDPASSVSEHWIADPVRNDSRECNDNRGRNVLHQHPLDAAGIGPLHIICQPLLAQNLVRHLDHDVVGL